MKQERINLAYFGAKALFEVGAKEEEVMLKLKRDFGNDDNDLNYLPAIMGIAKDQASAPQHNVN